MKNTLLLFLLLLLLAGITFWYQTSIPEDGNSGDWGTSLTIEDTDRIYKIFIVARHGTSYKLEKKPEGWYVNGKYKVRPAKIRYILQTLERQRVKYIPTKAASENIVKNMASTGLKVETYDANDEPILTFYIGGTSNDERGTYMIKEGSNQPLVMHLPGWEGGLRTRFWDDPDNWRDRTVFSTPIDDIEYVKVNYPRQKSQSFEIIRKEKAYNVQPVYKTTALITKPVTQEGVIAYLNLFKSKVAENFSNKHPGKDSIRQLIPFCEIQILATNQDTQMVRFFPQTSNVEYQSPTVPGEVLASRGAIERYFIDNNGQDFQLAQQLVFGKLFVSYDSFFR